MTRDWDSAAVQTEPTARVGYGAPTRQIGPRRGATGAEQSDTKSRRAKRNVAMWLDRVRTCPTLTLSITSILSATISRMSSQPSRAIEASKMCAPALVIRWEVCCVTTRRS